MTDNMPSPQEEGQTPTGDELKKLRKREQRALERLQEAHKAQAKALERFQRAEARLQKRTARLLRVEDRLARTRQQLQQASATDSSTTMPEAAEIPPSKPASREEAEQLVNEARAAAEAAEENTRLAAGRAGEIAARLDQVGSAHHSVEELSQLQAEETSATPEEIASIEEEEELTAAVTAETVAHITAERAAKAEAIAEISSAHTREARRQAQEAEQALAELRVAIYSGALSGEEAEESLWRAEHEVTRAQAFLADAEADEERAVNAAMNAEADAEVAEGMAFAAIDHAALLVAAEEQEASAQVPSSSAPAQEPTPENDNEADITDRIPIMRPQEPS